MRQRLLFAPRRGRTFDIASFRLDLDRDLRAVLFQLRFDTIGGEPKIADNAPNQGNSSAPSSEQEKPRQVRIAFTRPQVGIFYVVVKIIKDGTVIALLYKR